MTYREAYKYIIDNIPVNVYNEEGQERQSEANLIIETLTGDDTLTVFINPQKELNNNQEAKLKRIVSDRATGKPLAYILGKGRFIGEEFIVNENTLIPRTDTEFIYDQGLTEIDEQTFKNVNVLDMCCGTGVIGIMLKLQKPEINLTLADISKGALEVTKANLEKFNIEAKVINSDLFNSIEGKYNIIISNPPYINENDYPLLDEGIKNFEPKLALYAPEDGYYYHKKIIEAAKDHLEDGGVILLECGYDQGRTLEKMLEEAGFTGIKCIKDFNHYIRVVRAQKF